MPAGCFIISLYISIHAPANGATAPSELHIRAKNDFNPRSGERSDNMGIPLYDDTYNISIHAPANGATLSLFVIFTMSIFQSTLRRTERQYLDDLFCAVCHFNPRSGERSDCFYCFYDTCKIYFNPRSGERSDNPYPLTLTTYNYFNPRSGERSDLPYQYALPTILYFNPRSGERSDAYYSAK